MGLFSKIRQLFSKNIAVSQNAKDKIISIANTNGVIKVDSKLTVPDNFVAIIATKGKVCDIFTQGEYELSTGMMQKVTKIRKLAKPNKKGNFKKKFKGFVYFINLKTFSDLDFTSYNGIVVKEKKLFKTIVSLQGKFGFKISNPKKFLQTLLTQYYNICGDLPKEQIKLWVGETVDKFVQNKKLAIKYFVDKLDVLNDGLLDNLTKKLKSVGIEIINCEIVKCEYSKRVANIIKNWNLVDEDNGMLTKNQEIKEKIELVVQEQNDASSLNNISLEPFEVDMFSQDKINKDNEKVTKENIDNREVENLDDNYSLNVEKLQLNDYNNGEFNNQIEDFSINDEGVEQYEEEEIGNPEDVDDSVITAEVVKFKKCSKCGANNPSDAQICYSCKNDFLKICKACGNKLSEGDFVCSKCGAITI